MVRLQQDWLDQGLPGPVSSGFWVVSLREGRCPGLPPEPALV